MAAVLGLAVWVWPFSVDDALIALRYAEHLARGEGYRFNPPGFGAASLSSDGVTPLPWAFLLTPLSSLAPEQKWTAVKLVSLLATTGTAAVLARACARDPLFVAPNATSRIASILAPLMFACSVPVAMYAVSGTETSVASLFVMLAFLASPRALPWLAGLAAIFRPELCAWALPFVLLAPERASAEGVPRKRAMAVFVAAAPFLVVALIRVFVWGRPYPLALLAKPSDVAHGALYVAGACVFSGLPILLVDRALFTTSSRVRAFVVGALAYLVAVMLIGGDSMPFSRLVVPLIGPMILATYRVSKHVTVRFVLLAVLEVVLLVHFVPTVRDVTADRIAWMYAARDRFGANASPRATRVACVDVGWLGLATDGPLLDLAGVTDLTVASRPGGHTSKAIDSAFLRANGVDVVLVLTRGGDRVTRVVEAALLHDPRFREAFIEEAPLPTGASGYTYRVFRRAP